MSLARELSLARLIQVLIMPYTTVAEVRLNHELLRSTNDQDSIIAMHISSVDALIDGKIRNKVEIPFAGEAPEIIKSISRDLATFRTLRSLYSAQTEEYQDWIEQYKDDPMAILDEIRDCTIALDPDLITLAARLQSNTRNREAIFNLLDPESQDYHPESGDDRYGEA